MVRLTGVTSPPLQTRIRPSLTKNGSAFRANMLFFCGFSRPGIDSRVKPRGRWTPRGVFWFLAGEDRGAAGATVLRMWPSRQGRGGLSRVPYRGTPSSRHRGSVAQLEEERPHRGAQTAGYTHPYWPTSPHLHPDCFLDATRNNSRHSFIVKCLSIDCYCLTWCEFNDSAANKVLTTRFLGGYNAKSMFVGAKSCN